MSKPLELREWWICWPFLDSVLGLSVQLEAAAWKSLEGISGP